MKKLILSILLICSLSACGESDKNTATENTKPVVKIGAILPLSGDLSIWGNSEKQGLLLAQKDISPNSKFDYQLIIEDSANDNKNVQKIANKLIHNDKVQAIITLFDPAANIVAPLASQNKIIHFGQSWFPQYVSDIYNFNVYADIKDEAALIVQLLKNQNIKKVHLFTVNQTGFIKGTDFLKQMLTQEGISWQETFFNFGERDFKTAVLKSESFAAEAYVIGAFAPEADILTRDIKNMIGDNVVITGLDLGLNIANRNLYEDVSFAAPALPNQDFMNKYQKLYNDEGYLFGAATGYATLQTIVYAFENAPQNPAHFLQAKEIPSIYSSVLQSKNGRIFIPSTLMSVNKGKLVETRK